MDLLLKDKVSLVTGAGSQIGYGKGIALALAQEECDIISVDIDFNGARQTATEVETLGRRALAVKVDVRNRNEVDDMVKKGLEKFGRIDILINNAGVSSEWKPFLEMNRERKSFCFFGQDGVRIAKKWIKKPFPSHRWSPT